MNQIYIYGPPGAGKTTVGKVLAENLGLPSLDLDHEIEATAGRTIAQIMESGGEQAFRELETAALREVSSKQAGVISLGGGALLRAANRACVESSGRVVVLEADLPILAERLGCDDEKRPLIAGDMKQKLARLLKEREAHYKSFDIRIANSAESPEGMAHKIQSKLGWFHVATGGDQYDIIIDHGSLERAGEMIKERGIKGPLVIVTDSNVGPLYSEKLQAALDIAQVRSEVVAIPAGEKHKTLETVVRLWDEFIEMGLDRKSCVVALGGGVTGDLSGFAASTYMRGIDWVGMPTTLLAMADSSVGGKTGFDLPSGKNLIGSFHSPRLVITDPAVLTTLPEEEFRAGLSEVVKHGVISDETLFSMCSEGIESVSSNLDEIVKRAVAVKVQYIRDDPFEQGRRAALNFGHTVGHAVELVSGFHLRHGEAVAIGMVAEARLAERLTLAQTGLSQEISATLIRLGLPTELPPGMPRDEMIGAMQMDKKKRAGKVRFALPVRLGEVKIGIEIQDLDKIFAEG